jgi:hypothetical protein
MASSAGPLAMGMGEEGSKRGDGYRSLFVGSFVRVRWVAAGTKRRTGPKQGNIKGQE